MTTPTIPARATAAPTTAVGLNANRTTAPSTPARATATPTTLPTVERFDDPVATVDPGWLVIVWDDPVNLMSYVTFVFRKLFGHSKEKAHRLMMQVHTEGRAVVSSGPKEKAEMDVFRLHEHGLWATMEPDR